MGSEVRSFVAVEVSDAVRERLIELRQELSAAGADVRWTRKEGLHCTLEFLGEVEEGRLARVEPALLAALDGFGALRLCARGVGVFPNPQRPRVVWAGLEGHGIEALASRVQAALMPLGFAPEKRRFHAHVTLGRVRSLTAWSGLAACMRAHETTIFGEWTADRVVVFRSDLGRGGSVYTPLWTIPLSESSLSPAPESAREDDGSGNGNPTT